MFNDLKEFLRRKISCIYTHVCSRLISFSWILYLINQNKRRPPNVVQEKEGFDSGY
jgi:hypothetical protein